MVIGVVRLILVKEINVELLFYWLVFLNFWLVIFCIWNVKVWKINIKWSELDWVFSWKLFVLNIELDYELDFEYKFKFDIYVEFEV